MIIQNGFFRNMKLALYNFAVFSPRLLIICACYPVFSIIWGIMSGMDTIPLIQTGSMYIATLCVISPAILAISFYTVSYKYIINFSSTKKNFYFASIISIFLFSVFVIILGMVEGMIFGFFMVDSFYELLCLIVLAIFMGILGSFYGIIFYKNYAVGFFVLIVSIFLGFAGIIINVILKIDEYVPPVLDRPNEFTLNYSLINFYNISNPVVMIILIASGVILTVVNWFLVRKLEIKS